MMNENRDLMMGDKDKGGSAAELFAFLSQPELPGIPAPARACLRCGVAIPAPKANGRPRSFCSDDCRRAQAAEQRAAWVADNPAAARGDELTCWGCQRLFPAPPPGPGRLPRYCGAACRQSGRAAKRIADKARRRSSNKTA